MTYEAVMRHEKKRYSKILERVISPIRQLEPDITILLTASEKKLRELIAARNRASEQNDIMLKRALNIQKIFAELALQKRNVITIDRTNLDFEKEQDIKIVCKKVQSMTKKMPKPF